ncbi:MAG: hypothetical protein CMI52_00970 [Parcubacteria group bacterium]|nr:hypothetical protein [Parcubacteria group bacterium]|tara:strand:+ start:1826 stop:2023 length:198 start_codon:yes stop_codon:yes gene_type:complete
MSHHVVVIAWTSNDESEQTLYRVSEGALNKLREMVTDGHSADARAYLEQVGHPITPDLKIEITAF